MNQHTEEEPMIDAETTAEWARKEPQRSLITTADFLQDSGHSGDSLSEAMMALSLHMQHRVHGPRAVAARLLALADKFSGEADKLDRAEWAEWGGNDPH
jgi:hypothetical protein